MTTRTRTATAAPTSTSVSACQVPGQAWPTTRILFALAGTITLISTILAATVSTWFLLLTGFAGFNQLLFVATGACPVSLVIDRLRRPAAGQAMLSTAVPEEI